MPYVLQLRGILPLRTLLRTPPPCISIKLNLRRRTFPIKVKKHTNIVSKKKKKKKKERKKEKQKGKDACISEISENWNFPILDYPSLGTRKHVAPGCSETTKLLILYVMCDRMLITLRSHRVRKGDETVRQLDS